MSVVKLIGLFVLFYAIAWLYAAIISDVIAGSRRRARDEARAMRGHWYFDGRRWHRDE